MPRQTVMNLDDEDAPLIVGKRRRLSEPAGRQELTTHSSDHNVSVPQTGSGQVPVLHVAHPPRVRFLDDKDDNHHYKTCSARSCARCSWVRHRRRYRKGTTMDTAITDADKASLDPDAHILSLASWCVSASVAGKWGLGCAACSKLPESRDACSKLRKWACHKACRRKARWVGPCAPCPHVAACRRRGAATGTSTWTHWFLCLWRPADTRLCGTVGAHGKGRVRAPNGSTPAQHCKLNQNSTDALGSCGSNARERPTLPQTGCHHRVGAG